MQLSFHSSLLKKLRHLGPGLLLVGALTPAVTAAISTAPTSELDSVLAKARAAAKRDAWPTAGLEFTGKVRMVGIDANMQVSFATDGRYRMEMDGPRAQTTAWNGELAWSRPRRGPVRLVGKEEGDSGCLTQWLHSGYWIEADAPLAFELLPSQDKDPVLQVSVDGSPTTLRLTLDGETWLPARTERTTASGSVVSTYGDYREVDGIPLAHEIRIERAGVTGFVRVENAKAASAPASFDFDPSTARRAEDTRFEAGAESHVEIERAPTGHLLVNPTVDGEDLGWFILDTGAGQLCIDPGAADKVGMPEFGQVPALGIGGTVLASFRQGKAFNLGPMTIEDPVYVELDLAFLTSVMNAEIAGICGYEVFARSIFELDLDEPSGAILDPAKYELAAGAWTELFLEDNLPAVRCSFEGDRSGLFRIDTGATGTVMFHGPAVEELKLLEGRKTTEARTAGVGGTSSVQVGEMSWFELGGKRFEPLEATFAQGSTGALADDYSVGTLGGELLKPFRVIFDYSGGRIAFAPRESFD